MVDMEFEMVFGEDAEKARQRRIFSHGRLLKGRDMRLPPELLRRQVRDEVRDLMILPSESIEKPGESHPGA